MDAFVFFFFLSPSSIPIFSILFLLTCFQVSYANDDIHFVHCGPFDCGNLRNISYPFWTDYHDRPSYCGFADEGYKLNCSSNQHPIMTMGSQEFQVMHLNQSRGLLKIQRVESNTCPQEILITNAFNYSETAENITLFYNCQSRASRNNSFSCKKGGSEMLANFFKNDENECGGGEKVEIPVGKAPFRDLMNGITAVNETLVQTFDMKYFAYEEYCKQCMDSGGRCGSNETSPTTFACYCRDRPYLIKCEHVHGRSNYNLPRNLALAFTGAAVSLLITCIIMFRFRRKIPCIRTTGFLRKFLKSDSDIEAFIRSYGTLSPQRYSYSDVKKMTNSFKQKLGKGGYGSVYKGKLLDGHLVAVKLLNTTKGNGQEFINEVASISRTSHVNVVTLLGFCLEGRKRALIYEFMPNGSLERFIYKKDTMEGRQHLTPKVLYKIAIGIARGLEYLHRGCNTRILHFDIKPHNILLDENFFPKISDFGLAKLCTKDESIVSMLEARGTIGYIAPEVFCRSIGGVSHKSDVYSYGMMILEMVGGRKNVDAGVSQTSEIFFPHWIYGYVVQGNFEPQLLGLMTEEETEIARKMILVGLWCIQTNPLDRPSMTKVIEMLEGSIEVLQIPPKPYLSSPPRSPVTLPS